MDNLTDGQFEALENLAREQSGDDVPFMNIAAGRALTDLGLAERTREGWKITEAGTQAIAARKAAGA